MLARQAVLLTPLECAVPRSIPIGILTASVTSLESALTRPSQPTENAAALSPAECALTSIPLATPLECAVTKNMEGRGPLLTLKLAAHRASLVHSTQVLSFHILAHSLALFCTPQKLNSFIFNRFRTLCTKTPGWGCIPDSVGNHLDVSEPEEGGDGDRSQGCTGPRGRTLREDQARSVSQAGVTSE
jgi:hypothetical protein